jgi:hypothetical protein
MTGLFRYRLGLTLGVVMFVFAAALGTILASTIVGQQRDQRLLERIAELEERNREDVLEHRDRNEQLHSCIVDLALALADPKRDRTKPLANPCPEPVR